MEPEDPATHATPVAKADEEAPAGRLERVLASFFQERSILWLLGSGVLILVGSSVFLVTSHWHDITPAWKGLVLLGYTAAAFAAGRVSYFRLGLRRTGTVLLALSVLLIPLGFLALHWLLGAPRPASDRPSALAAWPLLGLNAVFAWIAARQVFDHFLRGRQPTYVASYLILTIAGALAPASPLPAAATSLVLWGVLLAGSLKVNRHVFWLVEEHRKPRIFGFFPLLLLGAQFLLVFVLHLARDVELQWLGLGVVLASLPVFLAADAWARVFEQRGRGVARPHPAAIVVPLLLGIALCAAGLSLSTAGWWSPACQPLALVPAAAVTSLLMALAARRTRKEAFAWAALLSLTLAYNFSPVLFRGLAASAVRSGASALREPSLPYAFYGLTYLPLLGALVSLGARWRASDLEALARPALRFAAGLGLALLAASLSHPKALLPVGGAMAAYFAAGAAQLRDRRWLAPCVAATVTAAVGWPAFAAHVLGWAIGPGQLPLALAGAAAALRIAGAALEHRLGSWPQPTIPAALRGQATSFLEAPLSAGSAWTTLAAALVWTIVSMPSQPELAGGIGAALIAGLLVSHALRWSSRLLAGIALVFAATAAIAPLAWRDDINFPEVLSLVIGVALLTWTLGTAGRRGTHRLATVLAPAAVRAGSIALAVVLGLLGPAVFALEALGLDVHWVGAPHGAAASALAIAWAFVAARRLDRRRYTWLGWWSAIGWLAAVAVTWGRLEDVRWIPLLWTLAALGAMPLRTRVPGLPAALRAHVVAINLLAFLHLSSPLTLAGLAALSGLVALAILERRPAPRSFAILAVSWHSIVLLLDLLVSGGPTWADVFLPPPVAALPLAALAGACTLASGWLGHGAGPSLTKVFWAHAAALRVVAVMGIAVSLTGAALTPLGAVLAILAFAALAAAEALRACERVDPFRAWSAEALVAAAIGYLVWFDIIELGRGLSLFALALGAFALYGLSRLALRGGRTPVLAEPLRRTALVLPAAGLALAIARVALGHDGLWIGARSLALLLGAGFYFWRGIEDSRRGLIAAGAAVANAAILLLWRELGWSNPQLYLVPVGATILGLVELCREEIPAAWQDPLRYAGALVMLASPVPDLVAGDWIHLLSLMALSTIVILASLALRVRALLYTGTAFLAADMITLVVRGTLRHAGALWAFGLGLGALLIVLAALCENRRETLQARLRSLAGQLETWN